MVASLLDFVLVHNLHVGTFNSSGKKFCGHDYIWLTNKIQELEITIANHYPEFEPSPLTWVNGNLYQPTNEVLGVLPLPSSVLEMAGIQPFVPGLDNKKKQGFLAQLQGTCKAVLPVHTVQERKLFNTLMSTCKDFYISRTELSPGAVKIWNRHVETMQDAYYKLTEQLSQYAHGDWERNGNLRQSLSLAFDVTDSIKKKLEMPNAVTLLHIQ
ncbi:hypothetical protein GYMLUDRAFT_250297 [Collybiopsis luxurians FD-317 M1]|uniref:Uncharacterized protein n=1 Tax=Collybiopsis luxurians FD-317 M1 TaxID=944289 RepID=A0A0D0AT46_9AGAR|nr:hypothetical protein GYMLUDRAFT_250297 [Collybiopsis luxurians FD-317 M1]